MIKTVVLYFLFLLISFGNNDLKNHEIDRFSIPNNNNEVCDLLSEAFLRKLYPTATNFEQEFSEKTYPTCRYTFLVNGKTTKASLTIAKGFGSEKNFDASMKYFSNKELLSNVGQKAYYISKINQVSAYEGKNIIHVNIGNDKKKTIDGVKEVFKNL